MTYALMIIGCLWMVSGMLVHTKNLQSALMFKAIPFISGLYAAVYAANDLGWLTIS